MDMSRFDETKKRLDESMSFGNEKKLVITSTHQVRIVGEFESAFEHFVEVQGKSRPIYCDGPESGCALCAKSAEMSASKNAETTKVGNKIAANEKFYFNVISRKTDDIAWHQANGHTMILAQNARGNNVGPQLFQSIAAVTQLRRDTKQDPDPSTYDVFITKTGTGMQTKYGAQFSGVVTPLTDEEKKYEQYDLKKLSSRTDKSYVQGIVNYLTNGTVPPDPDVQFNPAQFESPPWAQGTGQNPAPIPPQTQPSQGVSQQPAPPAAPPAPAAPPPPPAPPVTNLPEYQDTKLTADFNPANHYRVPCTGCSKEMQLSRERDPRDVKCWNCGKTYKSPWK